MSPALEILPQLAPYKPALIATAILCLSVLIQSFLTAPLAFLKNEQAPGMPLNGDHSLLSFRVLRTYVNSVENLPVFALSLVLALVLGLDAVIVNWLVAIHVVFRLIFWMVYYSGIGRVAGGARTLSYVGGVMANLGLIGYAMFVMLG
jgi:uncharacterized MAPEG superfamily protein